MKRRNSKFAFVWVFFMAILLFWLRIYPDSNKYISSYYTIGFCMILYCFANMLLLSSNGFYIFDPIPLVFLLYLFCIFIDPLINIKDGTVNNMGFDVMGGCDRATITFTISYFFLILGYQVNIKKVGIPAIAFSGKSSDCCEQYTSYNDNYRIALFIWMISFIFGCIELVARGVSVSYFLSLGIYGTVEDISGDSFLGFLGNFRFSMISAWLYLYVYRKKSPITIIAGLLTLEYFILRGFRHSLFVLIFSPIIFTYISNNKRVKFRTIISILGIIVIVMGLMQFIRGALRSGNSIDWASFDSNIFIESIKGNFDVYKTFYGIVNAVPSQLDYQWGMASIVSVVTMLIPRAIWPQKPISPLITELYRFCGPLAAQSGQAMPNISEFYLDFGWFGCVIGFFIYGILLRKMRYLYTKEDRSIHDLVLYSTLLPALMQVVLRGYSPSYWFLLLFYSFPILVIKRLG